MPAAFDVGASAYDRLVGASPGYHAHLRLSARRLRLPDRGRGLRLLDAGCGTGASTAALLSVAPQAEIVAVDASRGMLEEAQAKSWPSSVRFVHAPVEALAENGVVGPFDGILAAYLIRNLSDPDTQLRAFRDLLAPGATLAVHDYSVRDSRAATWVWHAVCWGIIIPSGWRQTRDATLYRHLWRSVLTFDGATAIPAAVARRGVHRGAQRNHAGMGDQHRAHLPRGCAAMTDRRRRTYPAPRGLPSAEALSSRPRAVVVGAGIAGLAAATGLAERGISVDVIEREEYLGGRVGAWTEQYRGVEVGMNRGFHALASARAVARISAPTLLPQPCTAAALICRWHGVCLDGDTDEFGWRPLPSHDDGVLAWVRLDNVGGEDAARSSR